MEFHYKDDTGDEHVVDFCAQVRGHRLGLALNAIAYGTLGVVALALAVYFAAQHNPWCALVAIFGVFYLYIATIWVADRWGELNRYHDELHKVNDVISKSTATITEITDDISPAVPNGAADGPVAKMKRKPIAKATTKDKK